MSWWQFLFMFRHDLHVYTPLKSQLGSEIRTFYTGKKNQWHKCVVRVLQIDLTIYKLETLDLQNKNSQKYFIYLGSNLFQKLYNDFYTWVFFVKSFTVLEQLIWFALAQNVKYWILECIIALWTIKWHSQWRIFILHYFKFNSL